MRTIAFDTTEGTLLNVDVSPDGKSLVFDLLGDIYSLPIGGGEAVALTSGREWDQAPRFSPDGASMIFISDRNGAKNIWELTLGGRALRQVTRSEAHIMGTPNWSHEGVRIVAGVNHPTMGSVEVSLHAIDPRSGEMAPIEPRDSPLFDWVSFKFLRPRLNVFSGVQSAAGPIYFDEGLFGDERGMPVVRLYRYDPLTRERTALTPEKAPYSDYKPQLSRDGTLLAYFRQYPDRSTEIRLLHLQSGTDRKLFDAGDAEDADYSGTGDTQANYAFTPDGRSLILWLRGKIHRVRLSDGADAVIPFHTRVVREVWQQARPAAQLADGPARAGVLRWPSLARDATAAFSAIGYVWVTDMRTGTTHRVTRSNDFEYMPAISPDGKHVAFVSFAPAGDAFRSGRLVVAAVSGGEPVDLLRDDTATFLLPAWSPDGSKIAVLRELETAQGKKGMLGWTRATSGPFHEVAEMPATDTYLSTPIYSRSLGFDASGRALLFSYPAAREQITLRSVGLDGRDQRTLATGAADVAGMTPSPNLTSLALTRTDGSLWVIPFLADARTQTPSTASPGARRVSPGGGYYAQWSDPRRLSFGFGARVFRYELGEDSARALPIALSFARHEGHDTVVFKDARIITMSGTSGAGRVIESGTVVIEGRRIAAVGAANEVTIPGDAIVIDAKGKTLMPGLIDVHYHRIGGRGGVTGISALKLPNPSFSDRSAIAYGVTTAWEPGGPWNDGVPATADLREAGRIMGPRWSHSASGAVGYPWELLTSYEQASATVEQHRQLGAQVLKEYNTPLRQQQQWLSAAAHERGMGIVSHIGSFDGILTRVTDGYTGGDHPYIPIPFFTDVRELMRQSGYIWTPNIILGGGSLGAQRAAINYFWEELARARPEEITKVRSIAPKYSIDQRIVPSSIPYETHRASRVAKQAAEAAQAGIHIGLSAHNMPAVLLHGELWHLWKGGLSAEDALRIATRGNAQKLGLDGAVGSIEVGKIADLLVLNRNPLEDILNTLSIEYTVADGIVYRSQDARLLSLR